MSDDLNLPASLERLEINPESRIECCKMDQNRNVLVNISGEPECTLQSLSLKAECPKGNCHCNRKREKEVTVKRLPFKRPIVRRSKLNPLVLRSPVLRLRENGNAANSTGTHSALSTHAQPTSTTIAPAVAIPVLDDPASQSLALARPLRLSEEDRLLKETERLSVSSTNSSATTQALSSSSSCAIQARSSPDDTTIDELASYFDLFVHIPKKMSFMAEMMYT